MPMNRGGRTDACRVMAALALLPPGPVSCSRLGQMMVPPPGQAELKLLLNRLAEKGLVQLLRSVSGEVRVCLAPDRMTDSYGDTFGPLPACDANVRADDADSTPDLVADMMTLFGLIAAERPVLNKKGGLPKRTCEAWSRQLTLGEEAGRRIVGDRRAMLPLPDELAVVLDLLLRAGLVHFRQGQLVADEPAMVRWLGKSDTAIRAEVYHLWLTGYLPAYPPIRHAAVMLPATNGEWIRWDSVDTALWNKAAAYGLATTDLSAEESLPAWLDGLAVLQQAGWLVCGETADGQPAFRVNRPLRDAERIGGLTAATRERPLFVQPDFELLLPASRWYALHELLAGFAVKAGGDRLQVYKLTEQSVQRALARGWSLAAIGDVLRLTSAGEVPAEVAAALQDWELNHARFRVEPACLVKFDSPGAAGLFAGIEAFAPLLRPDNRLGDKVYVLTDAEWEVFWQMAGKLGLAPEAGGGVISGSVRGRADKLHGVDQASNTDKSGTAGTSGKSGITGMSDAIGNSDTTGATGKASASHADYRIAVVAAYLHQDERPIADMAEPMEPAGPMEPAAHVEPDQQQPDQPPVPADGLFPSPLRPAGYVPAAPWSTEELFPGLDRIPAIWWKERRNYHPATMRAMLQMALEWGCRVEVGWKKEERPDGQEPATAAVASRSFLVTALTEDGNRTWRVRGREDAKEVDVRVDELAVVRLLLPGISPISAKNNT